MPKPTAKKTTSTKDKKTASTPTEETPVVATASSTPTKAIAGAGSKFDLKAFTKKRKKESALAEAAGKKAAFKSASELCSSYLPVEPLLLQYLLGQRGIIVNTVTEIIGQENTGKSSLIFSLLGNFARHNMLCLYLNSEPKMLETAWIKRLVSTDPEEGEELIDSIQVENVSTLNEFDLRLRTWVQEMRVENRVPESVPLVVVIDSISKLLNPEEEEALMSVDKATKERKVQLLKTVSDISKKPGVTAKWLHEWTRAITPILRQYNVTVIAVAGQNVNMNPGTVPESASLNKTRIGGTAMNQSTACQITITKKGILKDSKSRQIGHVICARCVKNSYGATRQVLYNLVNDDFDDYEGYIDQAIDMKESFCELCVASKLFGMSVKLKKYSSPKLELEHVSAATMYNRIVTDPVAMNEFGMFFKIQGYENAAIETATEPSDTEDVGE